MQKWEEAERDHLSGMKYKDIAAKYGVSLSTVKAWKARKWSKVKNVTKNVTKKEKVTLPPEIANSGLSPQKELFAQLVGGKRLPLYRAYQIAFEASEPKTSTAMTLGSKMAKDKDVALRIMQISKDVSEKYEWSLSKVIEDLTFLRDESKADLMVNGLKKSNADALLGAIEQISELLDLSGVRKNVLRKSAAEADIAEFKAKELMHSDDGVETTIIIDDMEAIPDE